MKQNHIAALAAIALMIAAPALQAQEASPIPKSGDQFSEYSVVEGWTIYADADTKTCLAERTDNFGNAMQMGVTTDRDFAYVGIFTLADIDVEADQAIALAVDGKVFVGESYGVRSGKLKGDYKGGYVLTNNPDLVTAIAEGRELVAFPENPGAYVVNLTGTKRAIEEARKCNAEMN